jgi:hypothetical protein
MRSSSRRRKPFLKSRSGAMCGRRRGICGNWGRRGGVPRDKIRAVMVCAVVPGEITALRQLPSGTARRDRESN